MQVWAAPLLLLLVVWALLAGLLQFD